MTIIPAIDIIDGKCVRLTNGDYSQQTTYYKDPLEVARKFEDHGLERLHLVDLDGAREGQVKNWKVLERIAAKTKMVIDFSGGISSAENAAIAYTSGAALVAVGSIALKNEPEFSQWLSRFGADKFIIGADVRNEKILIRGWTEQTSMTVFELIGRYKLKGVKQFFCTDVEKDGLLEGSSIGLYKKIMNEHPSVDLVASGGISTLEELESLREAGCSGAIIGKAIYENRISLPDLKKFL